MSRLRKKARIVAASLVPARTPAGSCSAFAFVAETILCLLSEKANILSSRGDDSHGFKLVSANSKIRPRKNDEKSLCFVLHGPAPGRVHSAACVSFILPGPGATRPRRRIQYGATCVEPRRPHDAFAMIRYSPPDGMSRDQVEWQLRQRGGHRRRRAGRRSRHGTRERVWVGPYRPLRGRRVQRTVVRDHIIEAIAIHYR